MTMASAGVVLAPTVVSVAADIVVLNDSITFVQEEGNRIGMNERGEGSTVLRCAVLE